MPWRVFIDDLEGAFLGVEWVYIEILYRAFINSLEVQTTDRVFIDDLEGVFIYDLDRGLIDGLEEIFIDDQEKVFTDDLK